MPEPITIETDLKDILTRFDQRLERIDERLSRLEMGQARIEEKLDSLDKRVEKLEGSQSKQVWTLIAIVGTALVGTVIRFVLTSLPAA
ncbi:MAG: hemolysin XhlA family protein [Snowella sp.]|nr:hemolysin XhlA family protein [Snowella sp.]